ncbi:MAG TPA: isochorismatase family protein, partial [Prolixibacteraceae bacterium]|nr:isochorismatase family protein [Prolixibacteraceae bacterium]
MEFRTMLFWNVDTQNDFVDPAGKLYVKDAELLKPVWSEITRYAQRHKIKVVNSADFHYIHSPEIDESPDFEHTFPAHCMAGTTGAEFIKETNPSDPIVYDWDKPYDLMALSLDLPKYRNIVIRKDAFDVFAGNKVTEPLLQMIKPEVVVVYGVTTNICVDHAVRGLKKQINKVVVLTDAIKELPGAPLPFKAWQKMGVKLMTFQELVTFM